MAFAQNWTNTFDRHWWLSAYGFVFCPCQQSWSPTVEPVSAQNSHSKPSLQRGHGHVAWLWPVWSKRKSAGIFCKTFPLLKEKCLWQDTLLSLFSLFLSLSVLWALLLNDTKLGVGAGHERTHANMPRMAARRIGSARALGDTCRAIPMLTSLTLSFLVLKYNNIYATFSGLPLLFAAQTILTDKSSWTLTLKHVESPCYLSMSSVSWIRESGWECGAVFHPHLLLLPTTEKWEWETNTPPPPQPTLAIALGRKD